MNLTSWLNSSTYAHGLRKRKYLVLVTLGGAYGKTAQNRWAWGGAQRDRREQWWLAGILLPQIPFSRRVFAASSSTDLQRMLLRTADEREWTRALGEHPYRYPCTCAGWGNWTVTSSSGLVQYGYLPNFPARAGKVAPLQFMVGSCPWRFQPTCPPQGKQLPGGHLPSLRYLPQPPLRHGRYLDCHTPPAPLQPIPPAQPCSSSTNPVQLTRPESLLKSCPHCSSLPPRLSSFLPLFKLRSRLSKRLLLIPSPLILPSSSSFF